MHVKHCIYSVALLSRHQCSITYCPQNPPYLHYKICSKDVNAMYNIQLITHASLLLQLECQYFSSASQRMQYMNICKCHCVRKYCYNLASYAVRKETVSQCF